VHGKPPNQEAVNPTENTPLIKPLKPQFTPSAHSAQKPKQIAAPPKIRTFRSAFFLQVGGGAVLVADQGGQRQRQQWGHSHSQLELELSWCACKELVIGNWLLLRSCIGAAHRALHCSSSRSPQGPSSGSKRSHCTHAHVVWKCQAHARVASWLPRADHTKACAVRLIRTGQ
jgi:hypothetical protein